MIPYEDIPESILITHPHHRGAREAVGGKRVRQQKWREEWMGFVLEERRKGRAVAEIADELGVTAETIHYRLREQG